MGYSSYLLPATGASSLQLGARDLPGARPDFFPLLSCLQTLPQPAVQGQKLPQEAPVGDDASVVLDFLDGLHKGEVVVQHEVGQHQGGRPAHSHSTVHQDLPCKERHKEIAGDCGGLEEARESVTRTGE